MLCRTTVLALLLTGVAVLARVEWPNPRGLPVPNLDDFAASGTNFTRNFALSPVCSPSKIALLTGTFSHPNSAVRNVEHCGVKFPLPPDSDPSQTKFGGVHEGLPTLIEILRDHGIFTAVTSKSPLEPLRKFPNDIGFAHPSGPDSAWRIIPQVIAKAGEKPFFIFHNTSAPHLPFGNIPRIHQKWENKEGSGCDGHVTNVGPSEIRVPDCYPDVPAVREDLADYYGATECIDTVFRNVLKAPEEAGKLENTLINFTSDQGTGLHRAEQSIYGTGPQVPLLIRAPDSTAGQRIIHPVSHLDLVPTLLDYLAIAKPASMLGTTQRPLLSGARETIPERPTMLTACHRYHQARAVTEGEYYSIHNLTQPEGDTLAKPQRVFNQDQYKPGMPWFNRTYQAAVATEGTLARELLQQVVEGGLPAEERSPLGDDPWMTRNFLPQGDHQAVLPFLKQELTKWRSITLDTPENLTRHTK